RRGSRGLGHGIRRRSWQVLPSVRAGSVSCIPDTRAVVATTGANRLIGNAPFFSGKLNLYSRLEVPRPAMPRADAEFRSCPNSVADRLPRPGGDDTNYRRWLDGLRGVAIL